MASQGQAAQLHSSGGHCREAGGLGYDPSRGAGEAASAGPRPSTCPLPTESSIKAANLGGMEAQMRIQYIHLFFLSIFSVFLYSPMFLEEKVQKPWTVGPMQPTSISLYKQSRRTSPTRVFNTACSCLALQRQSWVFETESMWPAKPKIFTPWPFTKKVCQSWTGVVKPLHTDRCKSVWQRHALGHGRTVTRAPSVRRSVCRFSLLLRT